MGVGVTDGDGCGLCPEDISLIKKRHKNSHNNGVNIQQSSFC